MPRVCCEGKCTDVWYTDSVMTAIIAGWRALETTLNYAKTNFNMLLNTNILFLERTIKYFIAQCLAIVK